MFCTSNYICKSNSDRQWGMKENGQWQIIKDDKQQQIADNSQWQKNGGMSNNE